VLSVAACCLEHQYQTQIVIFPTGALKLHAQVRVWDMESKGWEWASTFLNWIRYNSAPEYPPITKETDENSGWKQFTFDQYVKSGEWANYKEVTR
jgi:hypothetical protein